MELLGGGTVIREREDALSLEVAAGANLSTGLAGANTGRLSRV